MSLVRGWCRSLAGDDHDELTLFSSLGALGYERLRDLAFDVDVMCLYTPGIDPPATVKGGVYVDHIYV